MKFVQHLQMERLEPSLPLWERGLKYHAAYLCPFCCKVAPLVGAWIEIYRCPNCGGNFTVAPLVGAWIEINTVAKLTKNENVAPLVGAWIEIIVSILPTIGFFTSLPLWERGLKLQQSQGCIA